MKLIAKKENKRGITYAIAKSWRYVEKGLTEEAALALFNRRSA